MLSRFLTAVALVVVIAAGCGSDSKNAAGTQWHADSSAVMELTLTPVEVPATVGSIEVLVEGSATQTDAGTFLVVCPGLHGNLDPGNIDDAEVVSTCGLGPELEMQQLGALVYPDVVDSRFEATLTVPITEQSIEDGGVVILVGDVYIPFWTTVLLGVG